MATKNKEVAVVEENNTALALSDELAALYAEQAGEGVVFRAEDVALPFLGVVQSMSPQRKKTHEKYIPGAEEGMIFNSVSKRLYSGDEGIELVLVHYEKIWMEWVPRDDGGGLVAIYKTPEEAKANCKPGNEIKDTIQYYVLARDPDTGDWKGAILSMTSTKLKVARQLNGQLTDLRVKIGDRSINPPMGSTIWRMKTVAQTNRKGDEFFNFSFTYVSLVSNKADYEAAKKFRDEATSGRARVDYTQADGATSGNVDEDDEPPI